MAAVSTLGEKFVLTLALVTLVVPHTLSVDPHEPRLTKAALIAWLVGTILSRHARLLTPFSTFLENFVISATFVAVVIPDTLSSYANESSLAEAALPTAFVLTFVRSSIIALLVAGFATRLEHFMMSALFVALPLGHALSPDPHKSILAEATLLATMLVAVVISTRLIAIAAAIFVLLIVRTLIVALWWTLADFHAESCVWVPRVSWFTVAATWTRKRLDVARFF